MPELDTYHVIERYARDNHDAAAIQAFRFLKRRTELTIRWRVLQMIGVGDLSKLYSAYLGQSDKNVSPENLGEMPEADRFALYQRVCAANGIKLDPALFKNIN